MKQIISILVGLILFNIIQAQTVGHIQVKCESNVQIFLNGDFMGTTNDEVGGLILQSIPTGEHVIRANMLNAEPQEAHISLRKGQVLIHEFKTFTPKILISQQGITGQNISETPIGYLLIQTLPINCTIICEELEMKDFTKIKDTLFIENIPLQEISLSFTSIGKKYNTTVQIKKDTVTNIFINFLENGENVSTVSYKPKVEPKISRGVLFEKPYEISWEGVVREVLYDPLPTYPEGLDKEARIKIKITVLPNGTIGNLIPLQKADATLESVTMKSLKSLKSWRFSPLKPTDSQLDQTAIITMIFVLQ